MKIFKINNLSFNKKEGPYFRQPNFNFEVYKYILPSRIHLHFLSVKAKFLKPRTTEFLNSSNVKIYRKSPLLQKIGWLGIALKVLGETRKAHYRWVPDWPSRGAIGYVREVHGKSMVECFFAVLSKISSVKMSFADMYKSRAVLLEQKSNASNVFIKQQLVFIQKLRFRFFWASGAVLRLTGRVQPVH